MTLVFGNLVQAFVSFGTRVAEAESGDPTGIAQLPVAAAAFRRIAANDALILVYIGELCAISRL